VVESDAEFLQRSQIVHIGQLLAQRCKNGPVPIALIGAESLFQARVEIGAEPIVVEKRVVDIEQEHDLAFAQHGAVSSGLGSCQPSSPATTARAAAGPQVPGSYSATGTELWSIGSTTRHAASTPSSRVKSEASPRMASPSSRSYGDFSPAGE